MKNGKMDSNEALELLIDENFEKIYKKSEDKSYTRKDLYEFLKKELEEKEQLERTSVRMFCPTCGKQMEFDDSDSDMVWINLHKVAKRITNYWVCNHCGTSCNVDKKYTYIDKEGNELEGEEDDEWV